MKEIYPGHTFELRHLDGDNVSTLQFVQRRPHHEPKEGTTNQEVLRALIRRVILLNSEQAWEGNIQILSHLRKALALHEVRALLKHIDKDSLPVESFPTGPDGHFTFGI